MLTIIVRKAVCTDRKGDSSCLSIPNFPSLLSSKCPPSPPPLYSQSNPLFLSENCRPPRDIDQTWHIKL